MTKNIWSSLPLDLLRQEITCSGVPERDIRLFNEKENMACAEILFGSLPQDDQVHRILSEGVVKWIQLESVDCSRLPIFENKDVVVTSMGGVFSGVVAESVLGSLLAFYRGLWACRDAQQQKEWKRWPLRQGLDSLRGKKTVLLGGGAIASEIVRLLEPFECSVIVYRRKDLPVRTATVIHSRQQLLEHLKDADAVINTLPADAQTENFFSLELLGALPVRTVVVNVGRGVTMDEDGLQRMLKEQRLRAAILDVTQREPIAPESPYWTTPNLYLTQHTAGGHRDEVVSKCRFFSENLKRYLSEQPLKNQVTL